LTTFWGYYVKQIIELISLINIELPSASSLIEPLIASDSLQTPIYYH